ncbi:hypothetical protein ACJIZ3_001795 [Penstemon smallii]|uniref:Uncharacterized protein n=1 Tax=Penstemon smallii TaxID=265156 RepID=A0ABD3U5P6_9LAMI
MKVSQVHLSDDDMRPVIQQMNVHVISEKLSLPKGDKTNIYRISLTITTIILLHYITCAPVLEFLIMVENKYDKNSFSGTMMKFSSQLKTKGKVDLGFQVLTFTYLSFLEYNIIIYLKSRRVKFLRLWEVIWAVDLTVTDCRTLGFSARYLRIQVRILAVVSRAAKITPIMLSAICSSVNPSESPMNEPKTEFEQHTVFISWKVVIKLPSQDCKDLMAMDSMSGTMFLIELGKNSPWWKNMACLPNILSLLAGKKIKKIEEEFELTFSLLRQRKYLGFVSRVERFHQYKAIPLCLVEVGV